MSKQYVILHRWPSRMGGNWSLMPEVHANVIAAEQRVEHYRNYVYPTGKSDTDAGHEYQIALVHSTLLVTVRPKTERKIDDTPDARAAELEVEMPQNSAAWR